MTSERKAVQVGLAGVEKGIATLSNDIKAMGAKLDTCIGDLRELKGRMDATFSSVSASTHPAGKR